MSRTPGIHPTDGELELLQILWKSGPCSLGAVCTELRRQRPIAATTVATMLKVMLRKKLVQRKKGPQGPLWSAKATRHTAASGMIHKLIDIVFDGSAQRLVAHLLESNPLSDKDRKELRHLIDAERKEEK